MSLFNDLLLSARKIDDLWFDDAEHIIVAPGRVFRVSGERLKEKSEVFRDMFDIGTAREEYLGVPVIVFPDESAEVEHFLRAFFIDSSFAPPPAQTNFPQLLAILRLSHKYGVQHLLQRALQHVATAYSTTLKDWDDRKQLRTFAESMVFDQEFLLLQAALKVRATWAMPALYYSCGRYPMDKILGSPAWIQAGDLLLEKNHCLKGYVDQFASTIKVLKFLLNDSPPRCENPTGCYKKRLTWFHTVESWKPSIPLEIWNQTDWINYSKGICNVCVEEAKATHRQARLSLWASLPQAYGLPSWQELETKKARDLRGD